MRTGSEDRLKRLIAITNETFGANIFIFVGAHRDFERLLKAEFRETLEGTNFHDCDGFSMELSSGDFLMYVSGYNDDIQSIATISHEALHIAVFILNSRGVELDFTFNTECLNYLHEEIFKKALAAIVESRKRKKTPKVK